MYTCKGVTKNKWFYISKLQNRKIELNNNNKNIHF